MSTTIAQEYVSVGGNRHSAASSWSRHSGVLAFGADQNIAIWKPLDNASSGIEYLLCGHQDKVTAIEFLTLKDADATEYLISGSADGKVALWASSPSEGKWLHQTTVDAHVGAVNCIFALQESQYLVTGGADAKIVVWRFDGSKIDKVITILPKPRLIPLSLVLGSFPTLSYDDGIFLAVAGTKNEIQVYAIKDLLQQPSMEHQATLRGHESWVRSLCLKSTNDNELLLASASHDKYVRLWKFEYGESKPKSAPTAPQETMGFEQTLTAKVQTVSVAEHRYSITFEALLLGHEDWIYSAAWNPAAGSEQLLTASADGTLTIWELDLHSGIWISTSRLGEISGQKGATTATGSSGGFWTGIWSPDGQSVTCLGRTGSWRIWHYDTSLRYWVQTHGASGHVSSANGVTWSLNGDYLLSTSSDQTTRLHAEWKRPAKRTWHEFARPQIHGYDLNCISSTGNHQFTSGADEKLLRVFNEPRDIAKMLEKLCSISESKESELSETAAIPVLGLSNKAMTDGENEMMEVNGNKNQDYITPDLDISVATIDGPPTEDLLARHTLWPEHEKLYGHGYEISESAFSNSKQILATACKATSTDHAVVRLYNTTNWTEIKPPLVAHSLTVTRLAWSHAPDNLLLSVGRDRQWAVFHYNEQMQAWKLLQSNAKAHTRMILDAAWSPISGASFFATAGRDKTVKIWHCAAQSAGDDQQFEELSAIKRESAITALDFTSDSTEGFAVLAVGEESGAMSLHVFDIQQHLALTKSVDVDTGLTTAKGITRVAWRPDASRHACADGAIHLAIAAADGSVRILAVNVEELCRSS